MHDAGVMNLSSLVEAKAKLLQNAAHEVAARVAPRTVPLTPAIHAERKMMTTHRGQSLSYYVDRKADGRPLVLLHSVNACASAYEMGPLFERYRHTRPVYALDLPGFGFSVREERPYTIDLYVDSIRELLSRVKDQDGEADVVALSLSSEFAATVAAERGDLVKTLALLSPTGFQKGARRAPPEMAKTVLHNELVAPLLFDLVASRPSIRYFLGRSFAKRPDEGLLHYSYATAHQPGAYYAPIAFLSGELFTPEVRKRVYAFVKTPTLVAHDKDGFTNFDALAAFVAEHPTWQAERIAPTRGMPQFEKLGALTKLLDGFWRTHAHTHAHGHAH